MSDAPKWPTSAWWRSAARDPEGTFSLLESGFSRQKFSANHLLLEDGAEGYKPLSSLQCLIDCRTLHFERPFEVYTRDHNVRGDGLWESGKSNVVGPIYMQFEQFGKVVLEKAEPDYAVCQLVVDLNVVLWKVATFQYDPCGTGTPPFHGSHDKIRIVRTHDFPIGVMKRGMGRMQDELIAAACLLDRVFDYLTSP